jgi:hypothetical protein
MSVCLLRTEWRPTNLAAILVPEAEVFAPHLGQRAGEAMRARAEGAPPARVTRRHNCEAPGARCAGLLVPGP